MTRERLIELWPVMVHWKNEGEVQRMGSTLDNQRAWFDDKEPNFFDPSGIWRIKHTPKLVPLEAEDWLHGGPWWVKGSDSHHSPCMVTTVSETEVCWNCQHGHRHGKSFERAETELVRRSGSDPERRWLTCSKESRE